MQPDSPSAVTGAPATYADVISERRRALTREFDRIFPTAGEFTWEIGSGHGHFLTAYAAEHPNETCVGIDLVGERVERALRKRQRSNRTNLDFLRAEARLFLDTLPAHARIARTFVLFPDPWPKVRHRKNRIMQPDFLARVAAHSTPESAVYFRTDFEPYFEAVRRGLTGDPHWSVVDEPWPFEFATVFQNRAPAHQSLTLRRRLQNNSA